MFKYELALALVMLVSVGFCVYRPGRQLRHPVVVVGAVQVLLTAAAVPVLVLGRGAYPGEQLAELIRLNMLLITAVSWADVFSSTASPRARVGLQAALVSAGFAALVIAWWPAGGWVSRGVMTCCALVAWGLAVAEAVAAYDSELWRRLAARAVRQDVAHPLAL